MFLLLILSILFTIFVMLITFPMVVICITEKRLGMTIVSLLWFGFVTFYGMYCISIVWGSYKLPSIPPKVEHALINSYMIDLNDNSVLIWFSGEREVTRIQDPEVFRIAFKSGLDNTQFEKHTRTWQSPFFKILNTSKTEFVYKK